jgi:hypothetical protein
VPEPTGPSQTRAGYPENRKPLRAIEHCGLDWWLVVDSCRNPASKKPVALEYLSEIGVDVTERVLLVAATHWDNDHIGGLAEVFRLAKNAAFACPATANKDEFRRILETVTGTRLLYGGSGAGEMFDIMEELGKRGSRYPTPKLAVAHKDLLEIHDALPVRVQALLLRRLQAISSRYLENRRPRLQGPPDSNPIRAQYAAGSARSASALLPAARVG